MVALATPMHLDGALDTAALRRFVDFQIDNGTTAIIAVGTTGESPTLDMQEHCEVIRLTLEYARGRVPVIAGTGSNSTIEAIELTQCAQEAGAQACLLVAPYYNKPTQGDCRSGADTADPVQRSRAHGLRHSAGHGRAPCPDSEYCRYQGGDRKSRSGARTAQALPERL
jgi:hypothetical protein